MVRHDGPCGYVWALPLLVGDGPENAMGGYPNACQGHLRYDRLVQSRRQFTTICITRAERSVSVERTIYVRTGNGLMTSGCEPRLGSR